LATLNILQVLPTPLPDPDQWRHVGRKLPVHTQIPLDSIEVGAVQRGAIRTRFGRQYLVSPLKRQNLLGCVRRSQQPFAQQFPTDARAGAIDQTPDGRAACHRHRHNL
jgi:hypothetical protein